MTAIPAGLLGHAPPPGPTAARRAALLVVLVCFGAAPATAAVAVEVLARPAAQAVGWYLGGPGGAPSPIGVHLLAAAAATGVVAGCLRSARRPPARHPTGRGPAGRRRTR